LPDETNIAVSKYRLEMSRRFLDTASLCLDAGDYKTAANRSYYCIFHAMRAVLALEPFDSKKHSGIISAFNQRYIKTEIFPKAFYKMIDSAFRVRGGSDYDDFYVIAKETVEQQNGNARVFLEAVEKHLGEQFAICTHRENS
jgi:uncharacterized protein (UPF0332 family)